MKKITIEREVLLPCPFCGDDGDKGRQEVTQMIEGRNKFARVACRACGAMCPEENWNRRAAQPVSGPLNYGSVLDALDGLPNDIKAEFENLARLVRAYGCQIGHCEHDKHLPTAQAAQPADAQPTIELHMDPDGECSLFWIGPESQFVPGAKFYAAPPTPAAVPRGYAVVPIAPTQEMITTGAIALVKASDSDLDPTREEISAIYRAMIAATGDNP